MHSQSNPLVLTRPSRHAGPAHRITVDSATLRPLSCTCQAGRHGLLCWAVIDVTATELVPTARQRWVEACGEVDIRAAAAVLTQTRKWAAAARELQALRAGTDLAQHFADPANYAHAANLATYQPASAA
jgi:hypothetical protein